MKLPITYGVSTAAAQSSKDLFGKVSVATITRLGTRAWSGSYFCGE